MKTVKNKLENWRTTTIFNFLNFQLQKKKEKEKQTKLRTWNLKNKYKWIKLSGFRPRDLYQSKLKQKKLKWYTWKNPKPPKDASSKPKS
jgi:hypothetical protein